MMDEVIISISCLPVFWIYEEKLGSNLSWEMRTNETEKQHPNVVLKTDCTKTLQI